MVSTKEKHTWIEKDHLGDWNPEEDCCWPTLSHPTQMTFFNQGILLLKKKLVRMSYQSILLHPSQDNKRIGEKQGK